MRKKLLIIFAIFSNLIAFSQQKNSLKLGKDGRLENWRCASAEHENILREKYPQLGTIEQREAELRKYMSKKTMRKYSETVIYRIPIVVHVVHEGEEVGDLRNLSQERVLSQIEVLNEDFRRKEGTNGFNSNPVGADIRIEFVPALFDPEGNLLAEPGIDRVNILKENFEDFIYDYDHIEAYLKPSTIWDPKKYLNIWTSKLSSSLLGYAQFPIQSGLEGFEGYENALSSTDGVVINYRVFGSKEKGDFYMTMNDYNLGRTTTHEVGHWLGLRHIWGDGPCGLDDYVDDTPESDAPNYGCKINHGSCGSIDMVENYMDYSVDACMNTFTIGQKERIHTVLELSPRRRELIYSDAIYYEKPLVDFGAEKTNIFIGRSIQFVNKTKNAISYKWHFEGGNPQTSEEINPVVFYDSTGAFSVQLTAINPLGDTILSKHNYILVKNPTVPPVGNFTQNRSNILAGEEVQFTDLSSDDVSKWNWYFEGGIPEFSNEKNPSVLYKNAGSFVVSLNVENNNFKDPITRESNVHVGAGALISVNPDSLFRTYKVLNGVNYLEQIQVSSLGFNDLIYSFSDVNIFAKEEEVLGLQTQESVLKNLSFAESKLSSVKTEKSRNIEVLKVEGSETIDQLYHDNNAEPDGYYGFDVAYPFTVANLFRIRDQSFILTHIQVYYRTGSIKNAEIIVEVHEMKNSLSDMEFLHSVRHISNEVMGTEGKFVTVDLGKEILLEDKKNYVVVVTFPKEIDIYPAAFTNHDPSLPKIGKSYYFNGMSFKVNPDYENYKVRALQMRPYLPKLVIDETNKVLKSGQTVIEDVNVDITYAPNGSYFYNINVKSNDYNDSLVNVPFKIDVKGQNSILKTDKNFVEFGTVKKGYSKTLQLNLTNIGLGNLDFNQVLIEGNPDYSLNFEQISIKPKASSTLEVTFTPTVAGDSFAQLVIITNSAEGPIEIPISGLGSETGLFSTNKNQIDVNIGSGSYEKQTFSIINQGKSVLFYEILDFDNEGNSNSKSFIKGVNKTSGYLIPSATDEISFLVDATDLNDGFYQYELLIKTDDPAAKEVKIPVNINVLGTPIADISTFNIDFGTSFIGGKFAKKIYIKNIGTKSFTLESITPTANFSSNIINPQEILPNDSLKIDIYFEPNSEEIYAQTLQIFGAPGVDSINVKGVGAVSPEANITIDKINFDLLYGDKDIMNISIKNNYGSDLIYEINAPSFVKNISKSTIYDYIVESNKTTNLTFDWEDIAQDENKVLYKSYDVAKIDLPFSFSFFELNYKTMYINRKGFAYFGKEPKKYYNYLTIPSNVEYEPNNIIAIFNKDIKSYVIKHCYVKADENKVTVQVNDVKHKSSKVLGSFDYQIIIYADGKIQFKINNAVDVDFFDNFIVGIENSRGDEGIVISDNSNNILENKFIAEIRNKTDEGIIKAGEEKQLTAEVITDNLFGGIYNSTIILKSNDLNNPNIINPIYLKVNAYPILTCNDTISFEENLMVLPSLENFETQTINIKNEGRDTLFIDSLTFNSNEFLTTQGNYFYILPFDSVNISITYTPENVGVTEYNFYIHHSEIETKTVKLLVKNRFPPEIYSQKDTVYRFKMLKSDLLKTESILLENRGLGDLSFSSNAVYFSEQNQNFTSLDTILGDSIFYDKGILSESYGALGPQDFDATDFFTSVRFDVEDEEFTLSYVSNYFVTNLSNIGRLIKIYVYKGGRIPEEGELVIYDVQPVTTLSPIKSYTKLDTEYTFKKGEHFFVVYQFPIHSGRGIQFYEPTNNNSEKSLRSYSRLSYTNWLAWEELVFNMRAYQEGFDETWLVADKDQQVINSNSTQNHLFKLDPSKGKEGLNLGAVLVTSDDPNKFKTLVPIELYVNCLPKITRNSNDTIYINEGEKISLNYQISDDDSIKNVYIKNEIDNINIFYIDSSNYVFEFSPNYIQFGEYQVIVSAEDLYDQLTYDTLQVIVNNINREPYLIDVPDKYIIDIDEVTTININDFISDYDVDDELKYDFVVNDNKFIEATITDNLFSFKGLDKGITFVEISAIDRSLTSASITFNIEVVEQKLAIEEYNFEIGKIMPNPTSGQFRLLLNKNLKNAELIIYSTSGQLVFKEDKNDSFNEWNIDITSLNSGVYILKLITKNQEYQTKIIKTRN